MTHVMTEWPSKDQQIYCGCRSRMITFLTVALPLQTPSMESVLGYALPETDSETRTQVPVEYFGYHQETLLGGK